MKRVIHGLAALAFCAPLAAMANEGYVVADIGLQAGPDTDYPTITELSAGTPVTVAGCLQGWTWCDVIAGNDRGWVPGTFLEEEYNGQRVIVIDYGTRIGVPVVGFSLAAYWDEHYHSRPFYAQRQEFVARNIHPHAPPRPSGVAAAGSTNERSRAANATITRPTESTAQQRSVERTTTEEQRRMKTQEGTAAAQGATTRERSAEHKLAPTAERVPQTAQRTDETRPQSQRSAGTNDRRTDEQRMAQQPRHEETPPTQPEAQPPRNPSDKAQNPRGAVTAKNQPREKPEPKTKDELNKPKKDQKDDNGGGKER